MVVGGGGGWWWWGGRGERVGGVCGEGGGREREGCIETRRRHHDHFVRLRNDLKGITSLMNHQVQHVMDDCACNAQDD